MITMMKNDQVKFQSEMRATVTELKSSQNNQSEALGPSINQVGSLTFGRVGFNVNNDVIGNRSAGSTGVVGIGNGSQGEGLFNGDPGGGYGSGGWSSGWRRKKLDLPTFDESNPDGLILWAERYFKYHRMNEEDKLESAVVALDGDALLWFQWENRRRPLHHWEELKALLLRQFRSRSAGSLHEQWLDHRQTSTVFEYRRRFIELMAPLEEIPEEVAKSQFINGLKGEIKAELRLHGPQSLDQAMELAVKIEDKLSFGPGCFKTGSNSAFGRNTYQNPYNSYNNQPFTQKNNNKQPISSFSNSQSSYFHSSNTSLALTTIPYLQNQWEK